MGISIKSEDEIEIMRQAGEILALIEEEVASLVNEGVSTYWLDQRARELYKKHDVKPAFLNYRGYPATTCFGVNDVVVHGIPSREEVLKDGDIVSIDMGLIYKGYYSDRAVTVKVGEISQEAEKLINITRDCLYAAIGQAVTGNRIGDISNAIQTLAEMAGFSVVKQLVGHGIGKNLHEEPQIPGFGEGGTGEELREGMTFAIETIINEGRDEINFLEDGWTTKTVDGKLSALFEHTIVVREGKAEILTLEKD